MDALELRPDAGQLRLRAQLTWRALRTPAGRTRLIGASIPKPQPKRHCSAASSISLGVDVLKSIGITREGAFTERRMNPSYAREAGRKRLVTIP